MWYKIWAPNGDLITTYPAATLLHWHFDQIQQAGETRIFAPVLGATVSREARQQWLRTALLDALPLAETEARALIDQVTPHSFRSGLSGDLFREGVALQRVGSICRWNSQSTCGEIICGTPVHVHVDVDHRFQVDQPCLITAHRHPGTPPSLLRLAGTRLRLAGCFKYNFTVCSD